MGRILEGKTGQQDHYVGSAVNKFHEIESEKTLGDFHSLQIYSAILH
jgi:hypothetical protein